MIGEMQKASAYVCRHLTSFWNRAYKHWHVTCLIYLCLCVCVSSHRAPSAHSVFIPAWGWISGVCGVTGISKRQLLLISCGCPVTSGDPSGFPDPTQC